jgi:hypothetical protein
MEATFNIYKYIVGIQMEDDLPTAKTYWCSVGC